MCSKRKNSVFRTITFRLTVWYTAFFGILSFVVFLLVYAVLTSYLKSQVDNGLLETSEEFEALYESHGARALESEFGREAKSRGIRRVFFRLLTPQGHVLAASDLGPWNGLPAPPQPGASTARNRVFFQTISLPGRRHRVRIIRKYTRDGHVIEGGMTLRDTEAMMERYRRTFGTALAIMLACGGLVGWMLARKAMSGVRRVTETATQIRKGDLGRRVPVKGEGQEVDALAHAFNEMLERIELLVKELTEVTDNIAHDLRSPITRIRGMAEIALTSEEELRSYREMALAVIEESDHLVAMINTMLEIAKMDSGIAEFTPEELDMREIVGGAVDLFRPMAEVNHVAIETDISSEPVLVSGDRIRLQRVVANLLDNGIKYTPAGGDIRISVGKNGDRAEIKIADTGIGIEKEEIPRIFDRFYRGDRSRSMPGSGLGLSLALSIVRAHDGALLVESKVGQGSVFCVLLPLSRPLRHARP